VSAAEAMTLEARMARRAAENDRDTIEDGEEEEQMDPEVEDDDDGETAPPTDDEPEAAVRTATSPSPASPYPSVDGMTQLPAEIQVHIMRSLDVRDLARLERVCKTWQRLAVLNFLWHAGAVVVLHPHRQSSLMDLIRRIFCRSPGGTSAWRRGGSRQSDRSACRRRTRYLLTDSRAVLSSDTSS
jgi:hypothetical protein